MNYTAKWGTSLVHIEDGTILYGRQQIQKGTLIHFADIDTFTFGKKDFDCYYITVNYSNKEIGASKIEMTFGTNGYAVADGQLVWKESVEIYRDTFARIWEGVKNTVLEALLCKFSKGYVWKTDNFEVRNNCVLFKRFILSDKKYIFPELSLTEELDSLKVDALGTIIDIKIEDSETVAIGTILKLAVQNRVSCLSELNGILGFSGKTNTILKKVNQESKRDLTEEEAIEIWQKTIGTVKFYKYVEFIGYEKGTMVVKNNQKILREYLRNERDKAEKSASVFAGFPIRIRITE